MGLDRARAESLDTGFAGIWSVCLQLSWGGYQVTLKDRQTIWN